MTKHVGTALYYLTLGLAKVQWAALGLLEARYGPSCRHCGLRTHHMSFHLSVEHTPQELMEYKR